MRVALVHDYLSEYGGAERVLEALAEMWPDAPIYTAFCVPGSSAHQVFKGKQIITSWMQYIPWREKLHSPLRFLLPWVWGSFNLAGYDLIITSAGWYITKGLGRKFNVPEICYCHTPPRWLYGYATSVNFKKYWPVRVYGLLVGHFLRMYDFNQAQKVDMFVANSLNVAQRITKFYRRDSVVIYPPVEVTKLPGKIVKKDYYLIVSRLVGGKGLEMAIEAAQASGIKLKVAGETAGWARINIPPNIECLGRVTEERKVKLMTEAKAFLALAADEDFGITPVESMLCGTPVIAFNGGGYKETVVDGKTGILFNDYSVKGLIAAVRQFNKLKWDKQKIITHAQKFSKERFVDKINKLVKSIY